MKSADGQAGSRETCSFYAVHCYKSVVLWSCCTVLLSGLLHDASSPDASQCDKEAKICAARIVCPAYSTCVLVQIGFAMLLLVHLCRYENI